MSGFQNRKTVIAAIAVVILIITGALYWKLRDTGDEKQHLIVSTTTSLYETGVLDVLKTMFEAEYPAYNVSFISQGTGLAIETAKRGDSDMILVHSPSQEHAFLEAGAGVNRKVFAYNFFIIVGPEADPAGITGMNPLDALNTIHQKGLAGEAVWVSRGDNSGTHSKEKSLWASAELDLESLKTEKAAGEPWYIEAGAGMTATLQLANEKNAYTLTDVATYLKNYANGNIELVKVVDSGQQTLNVYSGIVCNPDTNPRGMYDGAMMFQRYILSDEVQQMLVTYGMDDYGMTLFKPWIPELSSPDSEIVQWVEEFAYFDGTECPTEYRHEPGDLYN